MRKSVCVFTLTCVTAGLWSSSSFASALLRPKGEASDNLEPRSMRIEAQVGAGFSKTVVTTTYSNANQHTVEADFIYAAPPHSVVTGFAYWHGDERVEARIVEKERAKQVYSLSKIRDTDPALVEMIGKNTFRARLSPVLAKQDLKVEVTLAQPLETIQSKGKTRTVWRYPLLEETRDVTLDSLFVRVHHQTLTISTNNFDAQTDKGDWMRRRENFKPTGNLRVESEGNALPLKATLATEHQGEQGFFAIRLFSETPIEEEPRYFGVGERTQILEPERISPREMLVFGRYEGQSKLEVQWGENRSKVWLPKQDASEVAPEISGIAAQLWGARKLEELGKAPRNRSLAISVSNRFGIPCAWTSWLAVPAEERKRLDEEERRLAVLNQASELARKFVLQLEEGREYSPEALDYRARLRDLARSSKGRKYGIDEEGSRYTAIQNRMDQLAKAIQARKVGLPQTRIAGDVTKLRRLEKRSDKPATPFLSEAYLIVRDKKRQREVNMAALAWQRQVLAFKDDTPAAQKLRKRLENLCYRYDVDNHYEGAAWKKAASYAASELMSEAIAGRENGVRAAVLRDAGERLTRRANATSFRIDFYRPAIQKAVSNSSRALLREVESGRDDSPVARTQKQYLNDLFALAPDLRSDPQQNKGVRWQLDRAWEGRARETAYRLVQTRQKNPQDKLVIGTLERELDRLSANTEKESSDFMNEAVRDIRAKKPLLTARQYRMAQEAEANGGVAPTDVDIEAIPSETPDTSGFSQNYVRPGDPLIEVVAPSNSSDVIAILPSGEIKKLLWNENTQKWEARFDVPSDAAHGTCQVRIIIVDSSGGRRSFTMSFRVDRQAPKAVAEAVANGNILNLSLEADTGTERVKAITPWHTTINLQRSSALTFAAPAEIPTAWRNRSAKVRFILTDKAHNRTEKLVDIS